MYKQYRETNENLLALNCPIGQIYDHKVQFFYIFVHHLFIVRYPVLLLYSLWFSIYNFRQLCSDVSGCGESNVR